MIQLLIQLDIYRVTNGIVRRYRTPKWAWLRANRGAFDVEDTDTGIEIVAAGRGDWVGWLELATEPVDETSTRMTTQSSTTWVPISRRSWKPRTDPRIAAPSDRTVAAMTGWLSRDSHFHPTLG
jgi:hypothetical protein